MRHLATPIRSLDHLLNLDFNFDPNLIVVESQLDPVVIYDLINTLNKSFPKTPILQKTGFFDGIHDLEKDNAIFLLAIQMDEEELIQFKLNQELSSLSENILNEIKNRVNQVASV